MAWPTTCCGQPMRRIAHPSYAAIITGIAAVLPVALLAKRGASGLDVYGWMGALATYGFIVAYALVCIALPKYLRQHDAAGSRGKAISVIAAIAMLLALIGNLYPIPEGPYGKLPYVYLVYLATGLLWFAWHSRGRKVEVTEQAAELSEP